MKTLDVGRTIEYPLLSFWSQFIIANVFNVVFHFLLLQLLRVALVRIVVFFSMRAQNQKRLFFLQRSNSIGRLQIGHRGRKQYKIPTVQPLKRRKQKYPEGKSSCHGRDRWCGWHFLKFCCSRRIWRWSIDVRITRRMLWSRTSWLVLLHGHKTSMISIRFILIVLICITAVSTRIFAHSIITTVIIALRSTWVADILFSATRLISAIYVIIMCTLHHRALFLRHAF